MEIKMEVTSVGENLDKSRTISLYTVNPKNGGQVVLTEVAEDMLPGISAGNKVNVTISAITE